MVKFLVNLFATLLDLAWIASRKNVLFADLKIIGLKRTVLCLPLKLLLVQCLLEKAEIVLFKK